MAVSAAFLEFVAEQLAPLGSVRIRKMFGGAGVYCGELMFGLVADEVLYLKADNINRPAFELARCTPFTYEPGTGRAIVMSYWQCPDALYDDQEELLTWAREAYNAALRAAKLKKTPKPAAKRTRQGG